MSRALSSLKSYDTVDLRTLINDEMAQYTDHELKCISKDVGFSPIWEGGILHGAHLILKFQVSEDALGRLLYNGRLYNRRSWSYVPPKFIRLQGREAKEYSSFYNNYPTDVIEVDDEKVRIRRTCGCGGKLVYDKRAWLYCEKCHLIDNDIGQALQI
ncbi:Uncharacterised protein [uncultured archaeon]|nr:Uncharacterised protein [uncultured archaeon]